MRLIHAFIIAFSTYSRIPMPQVEWSEENKQYSMCFFPLIGAAVGAVAFLWVWLCRHIQVNAFLQGAIGAVIPLLVTGGIHMDGFMDTMDAIASWQPRERRLEILKDTHTGAFAVIGCAAYLLVFAGLMSELTARNAAVLCLIFVVSRSLSALTLTWFPKARKNGMLSSFTYSLKTHAVTVFCAIYVVLSGCLLLMFSGWGGLLSLTAAGVCVLYYKRFTGKFFGGVTGDLAGWFVQITELVMLLCIVIGGKAL